MDQANLTPTDEASAATTKHHHRHHHGAPADIAHVPAPLRASLDGASASVREKLRKREDRRGGWIKRQHPNMRLGADPDGEGERRREGRRAEREAVREEED